MFVGKLKGPGRIQDRARKRIWMWYKFILTPEVLIVIVLSGPRYLTPQSYIALHSTTRVAPSNRKSFLLIASPSKTVGSQSITRPNVTVFLLFPEWDANPAQATYLSLLPKFSDCSVSIIVCQHLFTSNSCRIRSWFLIPIAVVFTAPSVFFLFWFSLIHLTASTRRFKRRIRHRERNKQYSEP